MNLDIYIFHLINQFAGRYFWLDALAIFFAKYFEYLLILCLLLFLVKKFRKYLPMVIQSFAAAVISRFGIGSIIRGIWQRPRPFVTDHINLLFSYNPAEPSFPSGHAAFYFALSTVVFAYNKKAGVLFYIASFLITIARVFSGIHWPSDILVGAAIGIFSGWLVIFFSQKLFPNHQKQLQ